MDWGITELPLTGDPLRVDIVSSKVHLDWTGSSTNDRWEYGIRRKLVDPADKTFNGSTEIATLTDPESLPPYSSSHVYDDDILADVLANKHSYDYRVLRRTANDIIFFYHTDYLGAPIAMTDQNGSFFWKAEYRPFGDLFSLTANVENNLRFPGQYHDSETGLRQNWFRDYDPSVGRYREVDPVGLDGGLNLYVYALANPLFLIDPDGLRASIRCSRCRGRGGPMNCRVDENGVPGQAFVTNTGRNDPSLTIDDFFGENGPLPPGSYDVLNAYSRKFKRILPSPTNTGRAGNVITPMGTFREGIRFHAGTWSTGCLTTGVSPGGGATEEYLRDLVGRNRGTGGTTLAIEEEECECNMPQPVCR